MLSCHASWESHHQRMQHFTSYSKTWFPQLISRHSPHWPAHCSDLTSDSLRAASSHTDPLVTQQKMPEHQKQWDYVCVSWRYCSVNPSGKTGTLPIISHGHVVIMTWPSLQLSQTVRRYIMMLSLFWVAWHETKALAIGLGYNTASSWIREWNRWHPRAWRRSILFSGTQLFFMLKTLYIICWLRSITVTAGSTGGTPPGSWTPSRLAGGCPLGVHRIVCISHWTESWNMRVIDDVRLV